MLRVSCPLKNLLILQRQRREESFPLDFFFYWNRWFLIWIVEQTDFLKAVWCNGDPHKHTVKSDDNHTQISGHGGAEQQMGNYRRLSSGTDESDNWYILYTQARIHSLQILCYCMIHYFFSQLRRLHSDCRPFLDFFRCQVTRSNFWTLISARLDFFQIRFRPHPYVVLNQTPIRFFVNN